MFNYGTANPRNAQKNVEEARTVNKDLSQFNYKPSHYTDRLNYITEKADDFIHEYGKTEYDRRVKYYQTKSTLEQYGLDQNAIAPNYAAIDDLFDNRKAYIDKYGTAGYNQIYSARYSQVKPDIENIDKAVKLKGGSVYSADVLNTSTMLKDKFVYDPENPDDVMRQQLGLVPVAFDKSAKELVKQAAKIKKAREEAQKTDEQRYQDELNGITGTTDPWDSIIDAGNKPITEQELLDAIKIVNEDTGYSSVEDYNNNLATIEQGVNAGIVGEEWINKNLTADKASTIAKYVTSRLQTKAAGAVNAVSVFNTLGDPNTAVGAGVQDTLKRINNAKDDYEKTLILNPEYKKQLTDTVAKYLSYLDIDKGDSMQGYVDIYKDVYGYTPSNERLMMLSDMFANKGEFAEPETGGFGENKRGSNTSEEGYSAKDQEFLDRARRYLYDETNKAFGAAQKKGAGASTLVESASTALKNFNSGYMDSFQAAGTLGLEFLSDVGQLIGIDNGNDYWRRTREYNHELLSLQQQLNKETLAATEGYEDWMGTGVDIASGILTMAANIYLGKALGMAAGAMAGGEMMLANPVLKPGIIESLIPTTEMSSLFFTTFGNNINKYEDLGSQQAAGLAFLDAIINVKIEGMGGLYGENSAFEAGVKSMTKNKIANWLLDIVEEGGEEALQASASGILESISSGTPLAQTPGLSEFTDPEQLLSAAISITLMTGIMGLSGLRSNKVEAATKAYEQGNLKQAAQIEIDAINEILQKGGVSAEDAKNFNLIKNELTDFIEGKAATQQAPTSPVEGVNVTEGQPQGQAEKTPQEVTRRNGQAIPFAGSVDAIVGDTKGDTQKIIKTPRETKAPYVSAEDYVKQQNKLQEAARKQNSINPLMIIKNEAVSKLIDSLSPIKRIFDKVIKETDIPLSENIKNRLSRAQRADTLSAQYIVDSGLAKVIQSAPVTKALDQYLIAVHAADLEAEGIKTGRNLESDQKLIAELKGKYGPYAKQVLEYNRKLLDKAVEYGLVSKETAKTLKEKYPNYVPANRIFSEGELSTGKGTGAGAASISGQTIVQKIKGSERQIESPLASIVKKTMDVVSQGERNKAASILASYIDLPGNPFDLRELEPSETVGVKSVISYLDNGKVRRFETTPEVAAAAKALNKEQVGILGKIIRVPTRILRLGATGMNPAFAAANVAKDMVTAAINSKHPFRSSVFNPEVLKKAVSAALYHGGKNYAELVREGAGGTSYDIARSSPKQNVQSIRAGKNIGTKILYNVTHPAELFRAAENTIGRSEEFTRALQYYGNKDAAIKKGMSEADAKIYGAMAARANSIDFLNKGDYGAVLNSGFPYLNAGVQGSRTLLRNIKTRPFQTIAKIALLGILPTLTVTAWNLADPKRKEAYDDIADYEKEGNMIIIPPNPVKDPATGKWNAIKIPVSQEIANINNIARNALEALNGDKDFDVVQFLGNMIGTTTSLNAQSPRQLANQVIPQALKPIVEGLTNQNLFTGNQIVPDSQMNLPASDQYGNYTSGTAKVIGSITGLSPRVIDNTIRTSTGGAGQNAVNFSDQILAALGVIKPTDVKGQTILKSMVGRFVGASVKPTSDNIAVQFNKARDMLIKTPQYKSLSKDDQRRGLNRLQADITAIQYYVYDTTNPDSGYAPGKLTANQKALLIDPDAILRYALPTKIPSVSRPTAG
jgi:hypothetical protein